MKRLAVATVGGFVSVLAILGLVLMGETVSSGATPDGPQLRPGKDLTVAENTSARLAGSLPSDGAGPVVRFESRIGKAKSFRQ